jgi:hypothetical protein
MPTESDGSINSAPSRHLRLHRPDACHVRMRGRPAQRGRGRADRLQLVPITLSRACESVMFVLPNHDVESDETLSA